MFRYVFFFFFKQKTAYEMSISDWSSDVCSSDLRTLGVDAQYGNMVMAMEIAQLPVLSDNYIYLVHDPESRRTAVVDPAVGPPVLAEAARRGERKGGG